MKISLVTSPHLNHASRHRPSEWRDSKGRLGLAQQFVPMGLLSIAAAIERLSEVEIKDINKAINREIVPLSREFYQLTAAWLLESDPDLIGFMTEADSYHHLIRICACIKQRRPHVLTLLGGVHATATHRDTLLAFPAVDLILKGEGERAIVELVLELGGTRRFAQVGNLAFRDGGVVRSNLDLPLIPDLESLPMPAFPLVSIEEEDEIYVEIGRGCPFKCNFCFTAPYWQRKHRIKSFARIYRELMYLYSQYGRTDFNFTHDLFTVNRRWVIDFCQQLAASEIKFTWTCSSRTDTLDEEQIFWMKRAGCRNIYFGVETGTPEMQKIIQKNLSLEEAREIVSKATTAGIGATVGFIAGLPYESSHSLRGTLDEAFYYLALPDALVHLFGYSPYRGSALFDKVRPDLIFDPHYIDFPLAESVRRENTALMKQHFDVFTRYSWFPPSDESLDIHVFRCAEEYFPIINALKSLMLALIGEKVQPFDTLVAWTAWLRSGQELDAKHTTDAQGTIELFLEFLRHYIETLGRRTPVTDEMLDWEGCKHALRVNSVQGRTAIRCATNVQTNPSLKLAEFKHTASFPKEFGASVRPGTFAFYMRDSGEPTVVRLAPVAAVVLQVAKNGLAPEDLLSILVASAPSDVSAGIHTARNVVADLKRLELLVGADA